MGAILWWVEAYLTFLGVLMVLSGLAILIPFSPPRPYPWKGVLIFILAVNLLDKCYILFASK